MLVLAFLNSFYFATLRDYSSSAHKGYPMFAWSLVLLLNAAFKPRFRCAPANRLYVASRPNGAVQIVFSPSSVMKEPHFAVSREPARVLTLSLWPISRLADIYHHFVLSLPGKSLHQWLTVAGPAQLKTLGGDPR